MLDRSQSHDGRWIATASRVGRSVGKREVLVSGAAVQIRDAHTGSLLYSLSGHGDNGANVVAFSPDSGLLASGGFDDGLVNLWEIRTGSLRRTFRPEWLPRFRSGGQVSSLSFSPDGSLLACASASGDVIYVWEVGSGRVRYALSSALGVMSTAFTPDGLQLLTGYVGPTGGKGGVGIWYVATGKFLGVVPQTKNRIASVESLALSPDGRLLADAGRAPGGGWPGARVSDLKTAAKRELGIDARSVTFSPDGHLLGVIGTNDQIDLWSTDRWVVTQSFRSGFVSVEAFCFTPDGRLIVAGTASEHDGRIEIWAKPSKRNWVVGSFEFPAS